MWGYGYRDQLHKTRTHILIARRGDVRSVTRAALSWGDVLANHDGRVRRGARSRHRPRRCGCEHRSLARGGGRAHRRTQITDVIIVALRRLALLARLRPPRRLQIARARREARHVATRRRRGGVRIHRVGGSASQPSRRRRLRVRRVGRGRQRRGRPPCAHRTRPGPLIIVVERHASGRPPVQRLGPVGAKARHRAAASGAAGRAGADAGGAAGRAGAAARGAAATIAAAPARAPASTIAARTRA